MWQGEDIFLGHGQVLRQAFATIYSKCRMALQVQKDVEEGRNQGKQKT